MVSQGSQSLALGLAMTAASQLDEFVRSRAPAFGQSRSALQTHENLEDAQPELLDYHYLASA